MKRSQYVYESYDRTKILLKLNESKFHYKNLDKIENRSPKIPLICSSSIQTLTNRNNNLVANYRRKLEDFYHHNKLNSINTQTIHPILNHDFLRIDNKLRSYSNIKRKEDLRIVQKENLEYYKRMSHANSFLCPKALDEFQQKHDRLKLQISKVNKSPTYVLPRMRNSFSQSMLNTKYNKNSTKYDSIPKVNHLKKMNKNNKKITELNLSDPDNNNSNLKRFTFYTEVKK